MSLLKKLASTTNIKDSSILSESLFFHDREVISTTIPILNIAMSGSVDGGYGAGIWLVAGESRTFKTNTCLVAIQAYLNQYEDGCAVVYDSEGGITPAYLKAQGIDASRVIHVPINDLEELQLDIVKKLAEVSRKDRVIFMIDSLGNLASKKEMSDAQDGKAAGDMGARAKAMKSFFRIITPHFTNKDISLWAIMHTYMEVGKMYPSAVVGGGTGSVLSANGIFLITRSQEKDSDGDLAGWTFKLTIYKSRTVKEKSQLPMTVMFDGGIQKYGGLMDIAVEGKFVSNASKGWYSIVDMDTGEIGEKYRLKDTNTSEFWEPILTNKAFKTYVEQTYKVSYSNLISDDSEQVELESVSEKKPKKSSKL